MVHTAGSTRGLTVTWIGITVGVFVALYMVVWKRVLW